MCSCDAFAQKRYDGYAQVRLGYSTLVSHIPRIHVHRTITYVTSDDLRIAYVHICTIHTRPGQDITARCSFIAGLYTLVIGKQEIKKLLDSDEKYLFRRERNYRGRFAMCNDKGPACKIFRISMMACDDVDIIIYV